MSFPASMMELFRGRLGERLRAGGGALLFLAGLAGAAGATPRPAPASGQTAAAARDEWREFAPPSGGFTASLPGTPKSDDDLAVVGGWTVLSRSHRLRAAGGEFSVTYFDTPALIGGPDLAGTLLDRMGKEESARLKGETLADQRLGYQGRPGSLLEVAAGGKQTARVLLVVEGLRVYRVSVLTDGTKADAAKYESGRATAAKFLSSFRLVPASRPEGAGVEVIPGGPLNGKTTKNPNPGYPSAARAAHVSGTVLLEILVDEEGRVVAARPVSGHPLLVPNSVRAAFDVRFAPFTREGRPAKVFGTFFYNYNLSFTVR